MAEGRRLMAKRKPEAQAKLTDRRPDVGAGASVIARRNEAGLANSLRGEWKSESTYGHQLAHTPQHANEWLDGNKFHKLSLHCQIYTMNQHHVRTTCS